MANEHLKTASANLSKAVSDVKQLQSELRASADNAKRTLADHINSLEAQIKQLERNRHNKNSDTSTKVAIEFEIKSLQLEISKQKKDTDNYVQDLERQAEALDSQVAEFQSLSSRLQMLA